LHCILHRYTRDEETGGGLMPRQPTARRSYDGVVACQPVTVPYVRYSPESAVWWIGRALHQLVTQSGLRPQDLDGFSLSSFTAGPDTAIGLTQHLGLSPRWLDHIPLGGASGVVALRRAARAVQAGDAELVACVGADTNHVDSFRKTLSTFSRFAQDAVYPYGSGGPNASFALVTRNYMSRFGARREDFGKICVAQRDNALSVPHALMKQKLTLEAYLAARPIADPIHLFDCVMPCAGAEAFVVCREETARSQGWAGVRILSTIERHNAFPDDPIQMRGGWAMDAGELWAVAGVRPDKIDFVETYDDYPVISMLQFEDLGFCGKGEGPDFVRSHTLTNDGSFPHNTSGGQLSVGQAGAGGGYLGLVEAIRQLTGTALGSQVPNAKIGLVSGFGMINYDRGLASSAAILARSA
jgi:acetyl-CoA acetyltransferase